MKTIDMSEATQALAKYAKRARREPLIVTNNGKPYAVLYSIRSATDLENLVVSNDPEFKAFIERSRRLFPPGSGLSTAQVRRRLGLARRKSRRD